MCLFQNKAMRLKQSRKQQRQIKSHIEANISLTLNTTTKSIGYEFKN